MFMRRMAILAVGVGVVLMTVWFWQQDPFTVGVLLVVDLILGFLLLSGWRQLGQQERDGERIAEHRASQRRHAADVPREGRREVATSLPPTSDEDDD